jgi:hypothetical protein
MAVRVDRGALMEAAAAAAVAPLELQTPVSEESEGKALS